MAAVSHWLIDLLQRNAGNMRATKLIKCAPLVKAPASSATDQLAALRRLATSKGVDEANIASAQWFPSWGVVSLPSLMGKFRDKERTALRDNVELKEHFATIVATQVPARLNALIVGARSVEYIDRQLQHPDAPAQCVVMDHDLNHITRCALALRPRHGHRVHFVRCDPQFVLWGLLPSQSLDVIVFAMPVPHASKQASHRRLLTRDVFHLAHPLLKVRSNAEDAKGLVAFTDKKEYAEFAANQLEECKLLVPWARKRTDVFQRWLPLIKVDGWDAYMHRKGTLDGNAEPEMYSIAASKSGPTTTHAEALLTNYDFCRRYFDPLSGNASLD